MHKVIIWGIGDDYEKIYNQLLFEQYKGNIEIVALVARKEDIYVNRKDGYVILVKEQLKEYQYDYVIITSSRFFNEIVKDAVSMGIERKKIINGKVFSISNFDFIRYSNLIENPITIISDDCWGGYMYNLLGLPFSSPTINLAFPKDSFIKFIQDIKYYLEQPLSMLRESNLRERHYPRGIIGENDKQIIIHFMHALSFADAKEQWNKRKARVNYENIFVKMAINGDQAYQQEYLEAFRNISYKKICFFAGIENWSKDIPITYLTRFEAVNFIGNNKRYICDYSYDAYVRNIYNLLYSMDIFKLLNGESDFMRE